MLIRPPQVDNEIW